MNENLIEQLLVDVRDGLDGANDRLFETVYAEMRGIAAMCFRGERPDHTLTPTAVVHEAWLRLAKTDNHDWNNRRHFYACAACAMRRVLIDHARSRGAAKRGGNRTRIPVNAEDLAGSTDSDQILALDGAVSRLEERDRELGEIVRLRFYAGLTCEQAAEVMALPLRTFKRRWSLARACLVQDIETDCEEFIRDAG